MDLEFTLNVAQPGKFLSNKRDGVLQALKTEIEGKCINGVYVTSIRSLNKISLCRLETTNDSAAGMINICMTVDFKTFSRDDIIADAIVHIQENRIICLGNEAIIAIDKSPNNKLLINGQKIPVIITTDTFDYYPGLTKVSMVGSILLPLLTTPVYRVTEPITDDIRTTLTERIDNIEAQSEALTTTKAQDIIKLLSSHTVIDNSIVNGSVDIVKLIGTSKSKDIKVKGYWTKNLKAGADRSIYTHTTTAPGGKNSYIKTETLDAFSTMLHHIYAFRKAIIEISNYSKDSYDEASNVWRLMASTKIN
jgi:hypothetical protein